MFSWKEGCVVAWGRFCAAVNALHEIAYPVHNVHASSVMIGQS